MDEKNGGRGRAKEHYGAASGFLHRRPDGSFEDSTGRFAAWAEKSGKLWCWYDGETDLQFTSPRKLDAIRAMQRILNGGAAPAAISAGRPAWMIATESAARREKNGTPVPHARKPLPRTEAQLALGRTPKLITVSLIEVEGRQIVVGFDGSSRAHTLWTEER